MVRKTHKINQNGFTLVELMLAMAFFSSILMLSTIIIVQAFSIYNKGIAVKEMNSVGRRLTDDIVRVGTSASGPVEVGAYDDPVAETRPRCLVLGGNIYIWSYATDQVTVPSSTYVTNESSSKLVEFSRYIPASGSSVCPPTGANSIDPADLEPLLPSSIKVYDASIKRIGSSADLVHLKLTIGSFGGPTSEINPVLDGNGNWACEIGSLGNFCSFGTYETVIYLPNL